MDCREIQKFLHVYLDGELDERDRGEMEGHLSECPECLRQARFERWFRNGLRRSFTPDAPADSLRLRILSQIDRMPAARGRWMLLAAPLAMASLVGSLAVVWISSEPQAPSSTAPGELRAVARAVLPSAAPAPRSPVGAAFAAAAPLAGERELDVQMASSDPDRVRSYLAERLARRVDVPTFRGRARLVGGSAATADATAQLVYRYGNKHLTLQVSPHSDPTLPAQGIVVRREGVHQVARWKRDGFTYSMTSMLDPVEMVRLAAAEISAHREPEHSVADDRSSEPFEPNFTDARPVSIQEP